MLFLFGGILALKVYNIFKTEILKKKIDLIDDDIKVALLSDLYSFDISNESWSDVDNYEVSGTGYEAGGELLQDKSITIDNDVAALQANDVIWTGSTIVARYAVIYDDSSDPKYLIACFDFSENKVSSSGPFTIRWNNVGIISVS